MGQQAYGFGDYTFSVPTGVTQIAIRCGGGGANGFALASGNPGRGGGGGAFAGKNAVAVTPGEDLNVHVSAGGVDYDNTWVSRTNEAGALCLAESAIGYDGGVFSNSIGDWGYNGGTGEQYGATLGGGGGGGAGSGGNGADGDDGFAGGNGGAGGTPDGGDGGGANNNGNGSSATINTGAAGGGGKGEGDVDAQGTAGAGSVLITWDDPPAVSPAAALMMLLDA